MSPGPALQILGDRFDLTPFEREVLLLCAAVELDTRVARLCAVGKLALTSPVNWSIRVSGSRTFSSKASTRSKVVSRASLRNGTSPPRNSSA